MDHYERRREILNLLNQSGGQCSVSSLCKKLYLSRSTLRRDLLHMEENGLILRHHGGISLAENRNTENSLPLRKMKNPEAKLRISRLCRSFLRDHMVLFLDSSSTVSYLSPILLEFQDLTVITNGIHIAAALNTASNIRCYICPGLLKQKSLSILGEYSTEFLAQFHADAAFFSVKALRKNGVFEGDDSQALCKRAMLRNAEQRILLSDHSKEEAVGYFKLCDYTEINEIVSDAPFRPDLTEQIERSGCRILFPGAKKVR